MRSTEDEDSPKGYRSPKPATHSVAGRKALFAGNGGQLGVFRQTEAGQPFPSGCPAFLIQMLQNEDKDVCSQNKESAGNRCKMRFPACSLSKNPELASVARKQRFAARPAACLRPSPALRLCLATRFMAFSHFWR